jgi:putative MATE family efflux protein
MLRLAMPVLAEQLLTMLVGFTDWWLAGHYLQEPPYLAAMGLMAYVLWLLPSMFAAVAIGSTAMVSRFIGARQHEAAIRTTHQALIIGAVLTVLVTLITVFFGSGFVQLMQLKDDAALLATRYLWILVPVIPAIMIEQVGIACLRGAGDTMSGFVAKTIVNLVNVGVSFVLVTGYAGFPKCGWDGLALGTACGHAVGALIILVILLVGRSGLKIRLSQLRPELDLIKRLLRIGIPGGLDIGFILLCHLAYVSIINRIGTLAAAAHGLGVTIESMAYLTGVAFQVAATTMTGQFLGARDPGRATRSAWLACSVGGGFMLVTAFAFRFFPELLTSFFTGDAANDTAQATIPLLRIVALSIPSLTLIQVLNGALRGAGDTRWPLIISIVGLLGIRLPGACLFAWDQVPIPGTHLVLQGFGWGVEGAWYAMLIDTILRSILVVARFCHGGWKNVRV